MHSNDTAVSILSASRVSPERVLRRSEELRQKDEVDRLSQPRINDRLA